MHKKFEINRTKIKGDCQSGRKVVTHNSKSDLPLIAMVFKSNKYLQTRVKSVTASVCLFDSRSRKSRWRYQKMSLGKVVTNFMGSNLHPKFLPKVAKKRQKKPKVDFLYNYSTKAVK